MSFFEFPSTRTYDSDLGWLIKHFGLMSDQVATLEEWAAEHKEEYADLANKVEGLINNLVDVISPWDSSIAYHVYSIVEYQGTNYIAIQDVPVGAMITNTDYWQPANTTIEQINAIGTVTSELQTTINKYKPEWDEKPIDVLTLGVKNDGSEDCADIIETASQDAPLYFPTGIYKFSRGIEVVNSLIGAYRSRGYSKSTMIGAILDFETATDEYCIHSTSDQATFANIGIYANENVGIYVQGVESLYTLHGVNIVNASIGVDVAPTGGATRCLSMDECTVVGPYPNTKTYTMGVRIGDYAYDSKIDRCEIMAVERGVVVSAGGCSVLNSHIWPSGLGGATYWNRSRCILVNAPNIKIIGCTLDTASCLVGTITDKTTIDITNCYTVFDNSTMPSGGNAPTLFLAQDPYNTILNIDGFKFDFTHLTTLYFSTPYLNGSRRNIIFNNYVEYPFNTKKLQIGESYQTAINNATGHWVIEAARMSGVGAFVLTSGAPTSTFAAIVIRSADGTVSIRRLQGTLDVDYKNENGICRIYVLTGAETPTQIGVLNLSANEALIDPVNTMYSNVPLKVSYDSTNAETGLTRATVLT